MTTSTTTQKWTLGVLVGLVVLFIGSIVISNKMEESKLRDAEALARVAQSENDQDERLKALNVEGVRIRIGDVAADTLKACYASGYPLGYNPPAVSGLSQRRVAECAGIMNKLNDVLRSEAAKEKRRDVEYDKAHPVK